MYAATTFPDDLSYVSQPHPAMNSKITTKKGLKQRGVDKRYACDLFWPDAALALEYDSFEYHGRKGKLADDARRRTNLIGQGILVVSATTRTVRNLIELDELAHLLARRLGKRLRLEGRRWSEKQHQLHGMLLDFDTAA